MRSHLFVCSSRTRFGLILAADYCRVAFLIYRASFHLLTTMTTSALTWKDRLNDLVHFNRQDMCQNVDARIDEAYDILGTFLTNPAKPLTEFDDYGDDVQLVDPSGEPKVEPAPFLPAQNQREQLKAIFKVELHKQWGYSVAEFKMMHKKCMHHFGCWLTFPMGHIPDISAQPIRANETQTLMAERQVTRQAFHQLVDEFLVETKRNLKLALEEKVPDYVGYAGTAGDDPAVEQALNMLGITAPLLSVEEYRVLARSEVTSKALNQSINRFLLKLKGTFEEMQIYLFEKLDGDADRDNQQQQIVDAPMED